MKSHHSRKAALAVNITEDYIREKFPDIAEALWYVYRGACNQRHIFSHKRSLSKIFYYIIQTLIYVISALVTLVVAVGQGQVDYKPLNIEIDVLALILAATLTVATAINGLFDPKGRFRMLVRQHARISSFLSKMTYAIQLSEVSRNQLDGWHEELGMIMGTIVDEEFSRWSDEGNSSDYNVKSGDSAENSES